jgi:hypothetical protein
MQTIMSTEQCQEAYNTESDSWVAGNAFTEEEGFDMSTVTYSESGWDDEKVYFMEYLEAQIKAYEKRFHTTVKKVAMAGRVGRWNGTFVGGKFIELSANPLEEMGKVDDIKVQVTEEELIQVSGYHHDGTNRMNLYFLTARMLRKMNSAGHYGYDEKSFRFIQENFKALKLTHAGRRYFNPTK